MKKQDTKTKDSKPHYALLDGLRGVAALLVVWYHVFEGFQFAGNKPIIDFINHGYLAVDFFFILSGFVVGYAYDNRWGKTLTLGGFFRRRLIRLQPMVCMGAVIGAVSFLLSGMERWDGTHATLWLTFLAFVCGCLMLPALPGMPREVRGNGEMFPLNGPCWSLFFEYVGNIVYALFIRRLSTRLLALLSFALCCALAWFAVTDQSGYGSIGVGWTVDRTNILGGSLRMLCPFTMGLLLSRIFKPIHYARGAFWISAALLLAIFHIPYIYSDGALSLNGVFEAACIIAVFPLVVWYAASGKTTDIASTRICRFLGDISYPLYIVHYPIMYAFYMWLIKTRQYTLYETWPAALAAVSASIILAWLCLKLYDMPVRKWLRNL
jgi:peptidoglycan/LPS O-acetylase OafA/YrhL